MIKVIVKLFQKDNMIRKTDFITLTYKAKNISAHALKKAKKLHQS